MADSAVARYIAAQLAERRWRQADLVRASGLDKNTISTLMTGRSKPSLATLGKIEDALELTRGTLAGLGEDPRISDVPANLRPGLLGDLLDAHRAGLSAYSDDELLDELHDRLRLLRRELRDATSGQMEFDLEATLGSDEDQKTPPVAPAAPVSAGKARHLRMLDNAKDVDTAADTNQRADEPGE